VREPQTDESPATAARRWTVLTVTIGLASAAAGLVLSLYLGFFIEIHCRYVDTRGEGR
jgi:hypothetical protein